MVVQPVREVCPHLRIDPLRIADGKYLRRVGEVRRNPFVVLSEAVVRERKLARQMCRDAVGRHAHAAVSEQLD